MGYEILQVKGWHGYKNCLEKMFRGIIMQAWTRSFFAYMRVCNNSVRISLPMDTLDVSTLKFVSSSYCPHARHIIVDYQIVEKETKEAASPYVKISEGVDHKILE